MKKVLTKEEILSEKIKRERQNVNDTIYINLARFLGAMLVLIAVGILIADGLKITISAVVLMVMGLSIIVGAAIWFADDKKTEETIRKIEDDLDDEEDAGQRSENFTQYT